MEKYIGMKTDVIEVGVKDCKDFLIKDAGKVLEELKSNVGLVKYILGTVIVSLVTLISFVVKELIEKH